MWLDWGPLPPLRRGLLTSPLREWQARRALIRGWEERYGPGAPTPPPVRHGLFVSLTSHAPRFATLEPTLRSLLLQDLRPEAVLLWIGHGDIAALPAEVRALDAYELSIMPCHARTMDRTPSSYTRCALFRTPISRSATMIRGIRPTG